MAEFFAVFVFLFGAAAGSFLNVCIHRLPKGESVVFPGSHCPNCNKAIAWHDNIPVVSFLALGAKCRGCQAAISPRYFAVEVLNGLIWLGLFLYYGFSGFFFAGAVLFSLLLAVTVTDFETGYIPDKLTFPGMAFGLAASAAWPELQGQGVWYWGLAHSFVGLLAGGTILLGVGLLGNWIFKKESMGGGDIKLLAMMGAFLGAQKALFVFFAAPFLSLPFALFQKAVKKAETIPFGPFLALAGAVFFIFGGRLIEMFLSKYGV